MERCARGEEGRQACINKDGTGRKGFFISHSLSTNREVCQVIPRTEECQKKLRSDAYMSNRAILSSHRFALSLGPGLSE